MKQILLGFGVFVGIAAFLGAVVWFVFRSTSPLTQHPPLPLPCAHVRVEKRWKDGPIVDVVICNGVSVENGAGRDTRARYGMDFCTLDVGRQLDVCHPNGYEIIETCVDADAGVAP